MREKYKPLELQCFETVDGTDVPVTLNYVSKEYDGPVVDRTPEEREATRQLINNLALAVVDDEEALDFLPIAKELRKFHPIKKGKTQSVMAGTFGNLPEARHLANVKKRKSIEDVKKELLELPDTHINFAVVGDILMQRWNRNFYKIFNDAMIASLVRVLQEKSPDSLPKKRDHRIKAQLEEIEVQANKLDRPLKGSVDAPLSNRPLAKVIPLVVKKQKKAVNESANNNGRAPEKPEKNIPLTAAEIFSRRIKAACEVQKVTERMLADNILAVGTESQPANTTQMNFGQVLEKLSKMEKIDYFQVARVLFQWKPARRFTTEKIQGITAKLRAGSLASVRDLLKAIIPEA